jgi:NDP-sugar pyrophosphorylase family protein
MTASSETIDCRVVILAGGKGTRLQPFTTVLPKPLLPIGNRAILEIVIEQLRLSGLTRLTLAVGYLSHLIEAVFGDGRAYGVTIDYHHEQTPLGTAGALAGIAELDRPFLMMNGDLITNLDYAALIAAHRQSGNALTIATQERQATIDFGVLTLGEERGSTRVVTGYLEKPTSQHAVSMGIYVVDPSLLGLIEQGAYLDFPDLVLRALATNARVGSYLFDGLWLDVGRHEDYERAVSEFGASDGHMLPTENS